MKSRLIMIPLSFVLGLMMIGAFFLASLGLPEVALGASSACVPGPHTGTLTADETWCKSDSPHVVNVHFVVPPTYTLTIEPGVVIHTDFGLHKDFLVEGTLTALGTAAEPILFTSANNTGSGEWGGLAIDGGTAHLRHTTVRYGGMRNSVTDAAVPATVYHRANIAIRNGTLKLENSTISNIANVNLYDYGLIAIDSHIMMTDTLFTAIGDGSPSDDEFPIRLKGADTILEMENVTFANNTTERIYVDTGAMMGHDATLSLQNGLDGYVLTPDFAIPPGVTLTIDPGLSIFSYWANHQNMNIQGHLEALGTPSQPITFTSVANSAPYQWSGLVFDGGTGNLRNVAVRCAGKHNHITDEDVSRPGAVSSIAIRDVNTGKVHLDNVTIRDMSTAYQDMGIYLKNSNLLVENSLFTGIGSSVVDGYLDMPIYISGDNSVVSLKNNLIQGNYGPVYIQDSGESTLQNNAIIDSHKNGGLQFGQGAQASLLHTTIAHNSGNGVYIENGATALFTNTIVSDNDVGLRVDADGAITMTQTLWENPINIVGTVTETGHLDGFAVFAADGYHLTRYSAALERGIDVGVGDDIDGEPRPSPAGTAPDLGAVEYLYALGEEVLADKAAYPLQWFTAVDPVSGLPSGYLQQRYLLSLYYGSPDANPPDLAVYMTDTLPAELDFAAQTHNPEMNFAQAGQRLTWQTQNPLPVNQTAQVILSTLVDPPEPGLVITNTAEIMAGSEQFDLMDSFEVPIFPPLITKPGSGEICSSAGLHGTQVVGMAMGNAIVKLYENGTEVLTTTAQASGVFSVTYNSTRVGVSSLTALTAATCNPHDPSQCSDLSDPVNLQPIKSFWCPQFSAWKVPSDSAYGGTYEFTNPDTGGFATEDWVVVGPHHFPESTISLVLPDLDTYPGGQPPIPYIVVDDEPIYPTEPLPTLPPWVYNFPVPPRPYDILFWNPLDPLVPSEGGRLIDPDGYVFDVDQGFDINNPTLNVIEGVTVTCMVSMTEWGGWVPWPAHLYENQINPQVTGEDGYFAFFTPPGHYYLQVEGVDGFQPWRSPVVEVISEIVHVNVPYTLWSSGEVPQISLTDAGPDPAVVTVPAGSTVEWVVAPQQPLFGDQLIALLENPALRLLSDLDPLSFTDGWDGGMLAPGQVFRRQFAAPGTYTYTDGAGHSGQIVVTGSKVFLAFVAR